MKRRYLTGRNGRTIERVLPENVVDVAKLKIAEDKLDEQTQGKHSFADMAPDPDNETEDEPRNA